MGVFCPKGIKFLSDIINNMEQQHSHNTKSDEIVVEQKKSSDVTLVSLALLVVGLGSLVYMTRPVTPSTAKSANITTTELASLEAIVLPKDGVEIPVSWGDLGIRMRNDGVIDAEQFEALYKDRGGMSEGTRRLLYEKDNGTLVITPENSGEVLNLLWALGLGNKNEILEKGPMMDSQYGGAGNFASTGGWTLARGGAMDHYSMHRFVLLTPEQQAIVERVSKGIYRPCCGNSTHFPDCNHGMAMLGLLELMASQGIQEEEMYRIALKVNSYWFPDTYLTLARYFETKGIAWDRVDPKEVLGIGYSSGMGYQKILQEVGTVKQQGGSCSA